MMQPNPDQKGPNLSTYEVIQESGKTVRHRACGGMLVQVIWKSGRPPRRDFLLASPENLPGPIFCKICGHRAGRQVRRLLKKRLGIEEVFVGPGNPELRPDSHTDKVRGGPYVTFRTWKWDLLSKGEVLEGEVLPRAATRSNAESAERILALELEAEGMPRRKRKRTPRRARERFSTGRFVRFVNPSVSAPVYNPVIHDPLPQPKVKTMPTDMMLCHDGHRWVIRHTNETNEEDVCWYIALDRDFWSTEHAREVRRIAREGYFPTRHSLRNAVFGLCLQHSIPVSSVITSKDLQVARNSPLLPKDL